MLMRYFARCFGINVATRVRCVVETRRRWIYFGTSLGQTRGADFAKPEFAPGAPTLAKMQACLIMAHVLFRAT